MAIADVMAAQVRRTALRLHTGVDEANIPGSPEGAPIALKAINRILDRVKVEKAVHFCFGNYGGQTIQKGRIQAKLLAFLNGLHADHLVLPNSPTGPKAIWTPSPESTRKSRSASASSISK